MVAPNVRYRPRLADDHLHELMATFASVMVNGPRATGKTTTAAQVVSQTDRLDEPGTAEAYRADPDAALRRAARPLLIDEWQEVPEVLAAVKRSVDDDPSPGQFILTGSVRADLSHDLWAGTGRTIRLAMHPLTERELAGRASATQPSFLDRITTTGLDDLHLPEEVPSIDGYIERALRGGFPDVAYRGLTERTSSIWHTSYLDDLITHDARSVDGRKDPVKLRRYLNVLALNNAGMPSEAKLHREADVNAKTAAGYDRLLQDLYVLDIVPAWATSRINRLVRAGKRYLIDTGLAGAAAGLTRAAVLSDADLVGRYFDAFATAQLRPELAVTHPRPLPHHLRQEAGRREVDLVVEMADRRVIGIEYKAGVAPNDRDARHLFWLRDEMGPTFAAGVVVHSGPRIYQLGDRIYAVPLCALWGPTGTGAGT